MDYECVNMHVFKFMFLCVFMKLFAVADIVSDTVSAMAGLTDLV